MLKPRGTGELSPISTEIMKIAGQDLAHLQEVRTLFFPRPEKFLSRSSGFPSWPCQLPICGRRTSSFTARSHPSCSTSLGCKLYNCPLKEEQRIATVRLVTLILSTVRLVSSGEADARLTATYFHEHSQQGHRASPLLPLKTSHLR